MSMSDKRSFSVEPWCVTEEKLDLDALARTESVFALSNGHIGLRGNLDEGDPTGCRAPISTRCTSAADPLRRVAAIESGQTIINVTNGKVMRLLVDDEPFDVRYGTLDAHRRSLDLRAGTLDRQVEWRSPAGDGVRVHTTRLVSLTQRAVAALCYEVEPIDRRCGWCCSPSWSPTRSCRRGAPIPAPRRCSNGPSTARSTARRAPRR